MTSEWTATEFVAQLHMKIANVRPEIAVFEVFLVNGPPVVGRLDPLDDRFFRVTPKDRSQPHVVQLAHVVRVRCIET